MKRKLFIIVEGSSLEEMLEVLHRVSVELLTEPCDPTHAFGIKTENVELQGNQIINEEK